MKIKEDKFSLLIENIQDGYAYHQIVRDSSGKPVDCIFIDVNPAFETITGLNRIEILGKGFTEVMPGIKETDLDWINIYKQLAHAEKPIQFESFSEPLNRWLEISAFSPEAGYFAAVFQDITESKRVKDSLIVSETRYRRLFESAKDGILILDAENGKITDANPFLLKLLGFSKEQILGKPIWEIGTFKDVVENQDNFLELQQKEYIRYEDLPLQTVTGRLIAVEFISNVYLENQHKVIQCNIRDITERKRSELFQKLSGKVLAILNEPGDFHDAIQRILSIIKSEIGFDAIGMRLQNGEDFPYYTQYGFSDDFLSTENLLTTRDLSGDICRNTDGSASLECTCGLVLSGKTDPSNPLFTPGGSSWTNDSFPLLELPAIEDPRSQPRNQCIHQGYASVALVPIRTNQKIVGLLQLNDHRKGQFNLDAINSLEAIAGHIGQALVRKQMEETLKKNLSELKAIYKISATLRTAETLDEMLKHLLDETLKVLNTEAGAICLCHTAIRQLAFTASQGWFEELDEVFLKTGDDLADQSFTSEKVLVFKEFTKDSRVKYSEKIPEGWGGVCLPLRAEADVVGTLFVSVKLPREITSDELKLLTSLTEMAGTAIQWLKHYENNIRHLEQLQALRNLDIAISSRLDLRVIFKVILDDVRRLLNIDAAAILRLDPNTGILKYEAWRGFRTDNPGKMKLFIGEGFAGQAAMERKSIRIANLRETEADLIKSLLIEKEDAHSYYAAPMISKGRVEGVLEIFHRGSFDLSEEWLEFLETLAEQAAKVIDNAELVQNLANTNYKLIQAYDNTIKGWAFALDLRDKETEDHSQRVTEMTVNIAREMGMSPEELVHVRRGALLHDIGKMGVSDTILLKPGELTKAEWVIMRHHPTFAFEMLSTIEYLRPALDIPYCHHEKWDGTGYPRGLKHEEIPLAARIFAVVDVFDALTNDRPYRKAWSREEALKHIRQESGTHFDPQMVEMFFKEIK